jgi:signal transduction histidine kinase
MILGRKLTILGDGQFPEAVRPNWDELISGGLDAQWVEVQGVVLSATNHNMEIGMKGGHILCSCRTSRSDKLEDLLGAVVRVRGAVLAVHDKERHINGVKINIPSRMFVSVETPAPTDPFLAPLTHAKDLFTYNPNQSLFRRVKVTGQIIHEQGGVYYVMDGTNGMRLIPNEDAKAGVGDVVEAVGFPDVDNPFNKPLLTLRDAVLRETEHLALPAPTVITPDDLLDRGRDATLIRLQSRLLSVSQYRAEQVFELQAGARVYHARLDTAAGRVPPLRSGSLLEVTGVYAVGSDKAVPFELLLNSPASIRVLELPSWWTAQHALVVIAGMGSMILLVLIWNGILRQQVGRRTMELSAEIAERKRTENELVQTRLQHLVEQERTRIARDLHDDLGSRVTQIVLLNELALRNREPGEIAGEHTREVSAAARQIIQSLDETVWAVNPRNDTLPHLLNYLSEFAIEFLKVAGVRCRLDFPDHPSPRSMSAEARHNLFLTVKEALNNAARHAQATEVWVRATADDESLVFTVEDNGHGFENAPGRSSGDGLRNMQQRMEAIGGRFNIESSPDSGTKVTLAYFWTPRG